MFRKRPVAPTEPPQWLIVGLGNPGPEYRGTRHNVGFDAIDEIAEENRIKLDKAKHSARLGFGTISGVSVALAKPLTFMNLSGRSVVPLVQSFGLKPEQVLVIADDLDLALGKVRMRPKGGSGGHNGHKSISAMMKTENYPRIRIGIGRGDDETIDHVLSTFKPEERTDINAALRHVAKTCQVLCESGLEMAITFANKPDGA
ncbi:MAG: aminoacyl-tRNA hydrolase [Armatimonadetes bacterium]|nr:aminoacyl-tRNA hydrolase [Armatimonadota bacterium]